jgi:hypothetical protein
MIGRTNTGGGGGGGLNFKVVGGTTAPSNPKENMIWVNTSTAITDYVFSATQPSSVSGRVWISTDTSSTVEFNALKKHSIMVYPLSAKQYVSGAWVNKAAKSYQNGKWVDWWLGELFDNGNQWESVTGGWTSNGYTRGDSLSVLSGSIGTDGTITLNGSNSGVTIMGTKNPIDLTGYSSITAYGKDLKVLSGSSMYLMITKSKTKYNANNAASADFGNSKTSVNIPISTSMQGEYYIVVGTGNSAQQGGKITKIILNK